MAGVTVSPTSEAARPMAVARVAGMAAALMCRWPTSAMYSQAPPHS